MTKKQRVAFNTHKYSEMSSILDEHSLLGGHFNNSEGNLSGTKKTSLQQNTQNNKILIPHQNLVKVRKYRSSGKAPLMKKCTRTANQIKHNRPKTKPNAHLANLSYSPYENSSQSFNNSSISVDKSKENEIVKEFPSKNSKLDIMKMNSVDENSNLVNYNCDKTCVTSSDDDSNAFEAFIENSRPKKFKSDEENSKKPQKSTKNRISKFYSIESESDMSEDETSKLNNKKGKKLKSCVLQDNPPESQIRKKHNLSTTPKSVATDSDASDKSSKSCYTRNKRIKRSHKVTDNGQSTSRKESECEMDIINNETHWDFSDTDLPALSEIFPHLSPNSYTCTQSSEQIDTSSQKSSGNTLFNNELKKETLDTSNVSKSTIIDLIEIDNECEDSFTTMPKIVMTAGQIPNDSQSHSDESEVELLDVIVNELPEKCPGRNVKPNCPNDSTNRLVKTENVDQAFSCSNVNTPMSLKTSLNTKHEAVYTTGICQGYDIKTEPNDKTINQFNLNKDKPESSIVRNAENSTKLSKKVKQEYDDDCEIILDIDSASNSNLNLPSAQNYNTKIKIEKTSNAVKEIATVGVEKSGLITAKQTNQNNLVSNIQNSPILSKNVKKEPCDNGGEIVSRSNPNLNLPSDSPNLNVLIENLKKEAAAYQEIVETEKKIGDSFKTLEKHQAAKVKSLQSELKKCLENILNNNSMNAVKKQFDGSEFSSLTSFQVLSTSSNFSPVISNVSDISVQNLQIYDTMNSVAPASTSENDIKPLRQEASTSYKRNSIDQNLSFGQKCMVCAQAAVAPCQQCCKVFFCSPECERKYWEDGHKNACRYL